MSTEIYYLSGTGNSLHVAKELQRRIPDSELIPLVGIRDREGFKTKGQTVGFIFPVHFMTAPQVVFRILKNLDLHTADYIFIAATKESTPCRVMMTQFDKILKKKGKHLDAFIAVTMAGNDPKFKRWSPCTMEKLDELETALQKKLDLFQRMILNKEQYREEDHEVTFQVNPVLERLGVFAAGVTGDGKEAFYAESNCTGCGSCEKVCLSAKIKMVNGKPEWQKDMDCFSCYACLNFCPERAIQLKSSKLLQYYTKQNGRYHHPKISLNEIAVQKLEPENGKIER